MEWLTWVVPLASVSAVGVYGYGILSQKVQSNTEAQHRHDQERSRHRVEMKDNFTRIFEKIDDLAEGVNKIKGKLDLNGD